MDLFDALVNATESEAEPRPSGWASKMGIRPGEGSVALFSAMLFCALLGSYYVLRPLRDAYGASRPDKLGYLFLGTLALTTIVQPVFGALISRFGRLRILPYSFRLLSAITIVFGFLLMNVKGESLWYVKVTFFCWVSIYSLVGVSLFWGLMADLLGRARSLRLFGFVAAGGTFGAILGSSVVGFANFLLPRLEVGPIAFAFISAALLELCVWLTHRVQSCASDLTDDLAEPAASRRPSAIGGGALDGFKHVARSPYLLGIGAYVTIYVIGSTLLYEYGTRITNERFATDELRSLFFGRLDALVNVAALIFQVGLTGTLLRRFGTGFALAAVPCVSAAGFAFLASDPTLLALGFFAVLRRATEYGLSKPGRDALFTVCNSADKYKSKLVIDTFVYRNGDAAAIWGKTALMALGASTAMIAWGLVGLASAGAVLSFWLGREFKRRSAET